MVFSAPMEGCKLPPFTLSLLFGTGLFLGIDGASRGCPCDSTSRGMSVLGVTGAGEGDRVRGGGPAWESVGFVMFSNFAKSEDTGLIEEPSGPSLGLCSMAMSSLEVVVRVKSAPVDVEGDVELGKRLYLSCPKAYP